MASEPKRTTYAVAAASAPPRSVASIYPEPYGARMAGRTKRPLGSIFKLSNFGVNLIVLAPGASSALHHRHARQDEFIYVLEGEPTLLTDDEEEQLTPGMCAGFPAGGTAHHLENRTHSDVLILEIGDRSAEDEVSYPRDDLKGFLGSDGRWQFTRKDGTPLEPIKQNDAASPPTN